MLKNKEDNFEARIKQNEEKKKAIDLTSQFVVFMSFIYLFGKMYFL